MSVIVKLLSKFDDSGIRKAKHSFGGLKGAIGAIGIGVGISQITDLLLDSAKAASGDAKSTKLLNTQLVRNAGATKAQIKQSDKFIEKLSLQTGILDDDLRPAYAKFGNVTGNVTKAQKLLTITLDAAAGSGKSQTKIAQAVAKAYDGNTKSLQNMFPELKKSKDVLGDFTKEYAGMAEINADPFMKFNNSMDILKEKLGAVILPLLSDFVDYISKPGGPIEQVSKFLDSFQDPNSDASKMFTDIKNAVKDAFGYVKDFFALFGNGDAMKGFGTVVASLVKALPALLALKGIMMLASAGKAVAGLVTAMAAIGGQTALNPDGTPLIAPIGDGKNSKTKLKPKKFDKVKSKISKNSGILTIGTILGGGDLVNTAVIVGAGLAAKNPIGATAEVVLSLGGDTRQRTPEEEARAAIIRKGINPDTGKLYKGALGSGVFANGKGFAGNQTNNVTINVLSADPKATVDALGKYVKTNGALPKIITNAYGR